MQLTLDFIPLWTFLAITIAVVFLSIEVGFRIAQYRKADAQGPAQAPVGSIVGATLGLLAFMLAFTFGLAANRFEIRRQLVMEESNAVGTTYLRAGYLEEPESTAIRQLLRNYVNLRAMRPSLHEIQNYLDQSGQLQDQLWAQAIKVAEKTPTSVVAGLFIQSLNDVIDIHSKRVLASLRSRIPIVIWIALLLLTVLSMTSMGYMSGLSGTRCPVVTSTLVLAFTSVIYLIADLDRSGEGILHVSQQSLEDLKMKISE